MGSTRPWTRFGGAAGLVASGLIAGGVLAGTFTASAAEDIGTTGAATSTGQPAGEELLTGDVKSQGEEAVLAEYPGATIERTETDSGGVYESHIVTADGERLTVLVGEDFAVTGTESGGRGGRGPGGGDCPEDQAGGTSDDSGTTDEGTADESTADDTTGSDSSTESDGS
jgi:hypothetical protein